MKPPYFYHGSTVQNLKTLEPRKRFTPDGKIDYSAIYATPLSAYAVAHSFPWSSDEGIDLDVIDERVIMTIPSKFNKRLKTPISIYKVFSEDFEYTKEEAIGYTWHTTKPVKIIEEIKYSSVEEAMKETEVIIQWI